MTNQHHYVVFYPSYKHLFVYYFISLIDMYTYVLQQVYRRRGRRRILIIGACTLIIICLIHVIVLDTVHKLDFALLADEGQHQTAPPFEHLIPAAPFDLYWAMWNTNKSSFRTRHLLVLESIFIHHPQATVIILTPMLSDRKLFQPYRLRGYKIYSFHINPRHLVRWNWYSGYETRDFLLTWDTSGPYFYSHFADYVRTVALYLYGGTYLDMDALILQPLPNEEFIGLAQTELGDSCSFCIEDTSGLYIGSGIIRFLPHRKVLQHILETTFNRQTYNPQCFDCLGPRSYTRYITEALENNDSELINLKTLEPYRLYPYKSTEAVKIFNNVEQDTSLELDTLMKRSYSLHLFGHLTDTCTISQGSLIDLLFGRYDLGVHRRKSSKKEGTNFGANLICPHVYVYIRNKQGRFISRDAIFLSIDKTSRRKDIRWNIKMYASNGTIILSRKTSFSNLNQAEINTILNELRYEPFNTTSIDTMMIDVQNEEFYAICSIRILIFSRLVTIVTKTMGSPDRWPAIQRLTASVQRHFPQTMLLIASDAGKPIDKTTFFNFISSNDRNGNALTKTITVHDLPEDSGLSISRNYLVNQTTTPFFFLLDDDFEFEEDSHLDLLLELIHTHKDIDIIAGKIPQDIQTYKDFSGIFLRYGQTLELVHGVSNDRKDRMLFSREPREEINEEIPCRQVDFVPNVFMGRTEVVRSVRWDDEFKVGEHEDFFLRFAEADRNVYTCRYIHVHHRQKPWWTEKNDTYYKKRTRAYQYFEKMLLKHDLRKLIAFNFVHADLDKNESDSLNG